MAVSASSTASTNGQPKPPDRSPWQQADVTLSRQGRTIRVFRARGGVPQILGATRDDTLYALGYMQARDRRTQVLFGREVARGRASERLADTPLMRKRDRLLRTVGLDQQLDEELASLPESAHREFGAFCEGFNLGLNEAGRSLPMWLVNFPPDLWDVRSILLMGNLLAYGGLAVGQQRSEQVIVELVRCGVPPERLKEFYSPLLDELDAELLKSVHWHDRLTDEELAKLAEVSGLGGSNAWAISPGKSATGHAILASDPHLEISRVPATWYEVILQWGDDHYLIGACLPGTPLFSVGRTPNLAWGATYSMGDTCDFFVEDCRFRDGHAEYRRGDDWHQFERREELIQRANGPTEKLLVWENELGVLWGGNPAEDGDGRYLSIAWTGRWPGVGRAVNTWLELPEITSVAAAQDWVANCPQPPLCWILTDSEGHIGLQTCGAFPVRPPHASGLVPLPAWDESNHWQGRLPVEKLPRIYDPPDGFLASANEPLFDTDGTILTTLPAAGYRKERIDTVLAEKEKVSPEDCQRLQYDTYSLQAERLLAELADEMPAGTVRDQLMDWDRCYELDSRGATLFTAFYRQLLFEIFSPDPKDGGIGGLRLMYLFDQPPFTLIVLSYVDGVLFNTESVWYNGCTRAEFVRRAVENISLDEICPWGEQNYVNLDNSFFPGWIGWVLWMHLGRLPIRGCHATVHQGHLARPQGSSVSFAPSYHFVSDMGVHAAWTNLPGGISESRFSPYYASDLPNWLTGNFKQLQLFSPSPAPAATNGRLTEPSEVLPTASAE